MRLGRSSGLLSALTVVALPAASTGLYTALPPSELYP